MLNKKKKFRAKKFKKITLQKNVILILLALLFTVIMYPYNKLKLDPNGDATVIEDIPITISLEGTPLEQEYDITSATDNTVTITVKAKRSKSNKLKKENFVASLQTNIITSDGPYQLKVQVDNDDADLSSTDYSIISIKPEKVNVTVEKIETRNFPVIPYIPNLTSAENMTMGLEDEIIVQPNEISIRGTKDKLDLIDHVTANCTEEKVLNTTTTLNTTDYTFYQKDNSVVDYDKDKDQNVYAIQSSTSFSITVPVYAKKELDFSLDIQNTPKDFCIDYLLEHLIMSESSITLSSISTDILERVDYNLGSITLGDIDMEYENQFHVDTEGYINNSGIEDVTVTLDTEGMSSKKIKIYRDNISIINAPSTYSYEVDSSQLNLTFIGDAEQIAQLTDQDVKVTIDMSTLSRNDDYFSMPVNISTGDYDKIWSVHTPSVWIKAELKETEATETSIHS